MKKRNKTIVLVVVPILLSACDSDSLQRDVYTRMEDCIADWGDPALCLEVAKADAELFHQQTTNTSTASHIPLIFWGPSYYPGNRSVEYNGKNFTPTANRAMSKPFVVSSSSSLAAKNSPATPTTRGGFGKTGSTAGRSGG